MTKKALIALAVASLVGSGVAVAADNNMPATSGGKMEKCYGIAKAGQNDCASKAGGHSCAGQSKKDMSPHDFKNVSAKECADKGGKTEMMTESK